MNYDSSILQSPLVSVIIPNYNHAQYLEQRMESVLTQTYKNFEIILLDDCSTDNSQQIIERYRTNNIITQIIINEINSGSAFKQWEKGIRLSKGEYIWIAESDDWCEPTFLKTIMNGITQNNCVLGYCQSYYIEDSGKIIWQTNHKTLEDVVDGNSFISEYMLKNTSIYNASMAVWRKDVFEKISQDFLQYKLCGDWLFWIEICRHGNVFISGRLLNYFRKHSGNVSEKGTVSGESFVEELTMFASLYKKEWISDEDYFNSLKREYVEFKAVQKELDHVKIIQIKSIFFQYPGLKKRLQNYYLGFYSRHIITKLLNKLFA